MASINIYTVIQAGKPYVCFENAEHNDMEHTGLRRTNFDGHPDNFNSTTRKLEVQIPENFVELFQNEGVKVDSWVNTRTGDPIYCVTIFLDYRHSDWYPVKIYVREGNNDIFYDENDIKDLQGMDFKNVALMARKAPKYDRQGHKLDGQYKLNLAYGVFTELVNPWLQKFGHKEMNASSTGHGFDMPAPEDDEAVPFN